VTHPIELVVFDLGGVLVQADRSWTEAAERVGFTLDSEWLAGFEQRLGALPRRGRGELSTIEFFAQFASASDGAFSAGDAERISHASLGSEYPGISMVFDRLEAAGIATAALSNTRDDHWRRMFPRPGEEVEFPTLQRITYRLASHLLAIEKPDLRAYRAVEEQTGYSGASVLYFDDKAENLVPAAELGWQTRHIDHLGDPAQQVAGALAALGIGEK